MVVDVLGTAYSVEYLTDADDARLKDCDGFCDKTSKRIVVSIETDDCDLDDPNWYVKKVTRHEIIHAFLFESGLHENVKQEEFGISEMVIDWIAVQFDKINKAFEKVGCL